MPTYDAFVSYSHAEGRDIARRLQVGVEKFAKPWYRARGLRLFLDTNSLTADPKLWSSIERALGDSSWLILVASPRVVESKWVDREIRWWLQNRSASRILIVVADGQLEWDNAANDFDPETSSALPAALRGVFEEEPHWVMVPPGSGEGSMPSERDLRGSIIDIAAPLRGLSKEHLVSVAAREHRRTMRWVRGTIAALSLLLLAALVAGGVALHQRGAARAQARLALSRQVASVSEATAATDLSASMLLAVQAYRIDPDAQTRAALFKANTSSPSLVRFLHVGGEVEILAGSADGSTVVAGLADGKVLVWSSVRGRATQVLRLPEGVVHVAVSQDGAVVAATDGTHALLWRRGHAPSPLVVPPGLNCSAVGLSPSGRTVVYAGRAPFGYEPVGESEAITVAPVANLAARKIHWGSTAADDIMVPSDHRALMSSPAPGSGSGSPIGRVTMDP